MITITNVGPFDDPHPEGLRNYELRVNKKLICKFQHVRKDGLAVCLQLAAEAVEEAQQVELDRMEEFVSRKVRKFVHEPDTEEL